MGGSSEINKRSRAEEPSVIDYYGVSGSKCDTTAAAIALEIVKDENEVNKKNMRLFMDENKKLKEEIASQRMELAGWNEVAEQYGGEPEDVSWVIENLTEERDGYENTQPEVDDLEEEIKGLKEDIKLLKEAGEKQSGLLWSSTGRDIHLQEEINTLKEENEIYAEKVSQMDWKDHRDKREDELKKENEKLKEENENLKRENDYLYAPVDSAEYIRMGEYNDYLQTEVIKLKEYSGCREPYRPRCSHCQNYFRHRCEEHNPPQCLLHPK